MVFLNCIYFSLFQVISTIFIWNSILVLAKHNIVPQSNSCFRYFPVWLKAFSLKGHRKHPQCLIKDFKICWREVSSSLDIRLYLDLSTQLKTDFTLNFSQINTSSFYLFQTFEVHTVFFTKLNIEDPTMLTQDTPKVDLVFILYVLWSLTYPDPTYPDTCLGTNYDYMFLESDSFIRIFSYPDSRLGNGGVRISEGPMYYWEGHISILYKFYEITKWRSYFQWLSFLGLNFKWISEDIYYTN